MPSAALDAVAAGGAGHGHRHLLRVAERTRAVARPRAGRPLVLVFFGPAGSLGRAVAIGMVAAAVGFGLIAWRTANLAAPTLSRPLFNINVEGRIADIRRLPEGVSVVLEAVRLKGSGVPPVKARRPVCEHHARVGHLSLQAGLTPASSFSSVASYQQLHAMRNRRSKATGTAWSRRKTPTQRH
jgi:hypothetical protein